MFDSYLYGTKLWNEYMETIMQGAVTERSYEVNDNIDLLEKSISTLKSRIFDTLRTRLDSVVMKKDLAPEGATPKCVVGSSTALGEKVRYLMDEVNMIDEEIMNILGRLQI